GAVSLRRQCRLTCKDTINACVAAGGKRPRCRRQTLRRCRLEGLVACGGAATTTTLGAGATTTTLPSGGVGNACNPNSATAMRGQPPGTGHLGGAPGLPSHPARLHG